MPLIGRCMSLINVMRRWQTPLERVQRIISWHCSGCWRALRWWSKRNWLTGGSLLCTFRIISRVQFPFLMMLLIFSIKIFIRCHYDNAENSAFACYELYTVHTYIHTSFKWNWHIFYMHQIQITVNTCEANQQKKCLHSSHHPLLVDYIAISLPKVRWRQGNDEGQKKKLCINTETHIARTWYMSFV